MVTFLADRDDIRTRALHRRIANRMQSDHDFGPVQSRVSEPREPGPYRVVADVNPQSFLDDDAYPGTTARLEAGFALDGEPDHDRYWCNWVEPDRRLLLGWHQDGTHPDLGPVHVQVNQHDDVVAREPATVIDKHPMAVVEARLGQLPAALARVGWDRDTVVGIEWSNES